MNADWPEFQLGERCSVKSSKRIFAKEYVENGVPFFRSKDVIDKSFGTFSGYDLFISEARYKEIKETHGSPRKGDVLISSVGNRSGQPYVVQDEGDFYFKDGNILWFSEFSDINPDYLAYWFKSDIGQGTLASVMIGSAQKALTIDSIRKLWVKFPSIEYQNKAAVILKMLDDKIELNRQTNQTLEHIAQAIFKSWFVDFEPVKAKIQAKRTLTPTLSQSERELIVERAAMCAISGKSLQELEQLSPETQQQLKISTALFPDALVESELGEVPEGWGLVNLKSITTEIRRGISPKYIEENGISVINQKCIRNHTINFELTRLNDPLKRKIDGREVAKGDVLINSTGVGTLGRLAPVRYIPKPMVFDSHVTVVRADTNLITKSYLASLMLTKESFIEAGGAGSTGQTELRKQVIEEIMVAKPSFELCVLYEAIVMPINKQIAELEQQLVTLAETRDTLLPKLLSGELTLDPATTKEKAEKAEKAAIGLSNA